MALAGSLRAADEYTRWSSNVEEDAGVLSGTQGGSLSTVFGFVWRITHQLVGRTERIGRALLRYISLNT